MRSNKSLARNGNRQRNFKLVISHRQRWKAKPGAVHVEGQGEIVAGVLSCGQEGGDSPLLLMCTSGVRTAMLRGGEAAGAEAEVTLTLPDAEPLIAMWEVRDRLLVYDADALGDDVTR